ncbi:hypothetical protein Hte_007738 [Hypoxylon texense]
MRLSALLSTGAFVAMACAKCLKPGDGDSHDYRWRVDPAKYVEKACRDSLAKEYSGNEQDFLRVWDDLHIFTMDFQIKRIKDSPRNLPVDECISGLGKETKCEYGGQTSYGNWQYMYAINVSDASDVTVGLLFAQEHGLRVTVKNTGRDYLGRSTGRGALALWTHHLNSISFLTTVHWSRCHGPFGSTYGLRADDVLELEVVTVDGRHLIATRTTNEDLFWALGGGGPGNYAAVRCTTLKAHPDWPVASSQWVLPSTNDNGFWTFIEVRTKHLLVYDKILRLTINSGCNQQMMILNYASYQDAITEDLEAVFAPFLDEIKDLPLRFSVRDTCDHPTWEEHFQYFTRFPYDTHNTNGERLVPRSPLGSNAVLPAWRDALVSINILVGMEADTKGTVARDDLARMNEWQGQLRALMSGGGMWCCSTQVCLDKATFNDHDVESPFINVNITKARIVTSLDPTEDERLVRRRTSIAVETVNEIGSKGRAQTKTGEDLEANKYRPIIDEWTHHRWPKPLPPKQLYGYRHEKAWFGLARVVVMLALVGITIYSEYMLISIERSQEGYDTCEISSASWFESRFFINVVVTRGLSFTKAKLLDLAWDTFVGQGSFGSLPEKVPTSETPWRSSNAPSRFMDIFYYAKTKHSLQNYFNSSNSSWSRVTLDQEKTADTTSWKIPDIAITQRWDAPFLDFGVAGSDNCLWWNSSTGECPCYMGRILTADWAIADEFVCISAQGYVWGFSSFILLISIMCETVWVVGCWWLRLRTTINSKLIEFNRLGVGTARHILDLGEAIRRDLGPNTCIYTDTELTDALKQCPPVGYALDGKDGMKHIGLVTVHHGDEWRTKMDLNFDDTYG